MAGHSQPGCDAELSLLFHARHWPPNELYYSCQRIHGLLQVRERIPGEGYDSGANVCIRLGLDAARSKARGADTLMRIGKRDMPAGWVHSRSRRILRGQENA